MKYPLVSIITINYNQPGLTAQLLASLRHITYPNVEVWVVDNASTDAPIDAIIPYFPEVHFIKNCQNLGFAGGNNIAAKQAHGQYLLFINNDVEVCPHFLEPLVKRLQSDESIGMVSPKIKYFEAPHLIQYAGSTEINPFTVRGRFVGHQQPDGDAYAHSTPTAYIHGASMLVSRRVIDKIGYMNPDYFLYYEELDWCARARRNGFKIWYEATSVVWHKESMTTGKNSTLKIYYQTKNRLKFLRHNSLWWQQIAGLSFIFLLAIPKNIIAFVYQKRPDLAKASYAAMVDFLFHPSSFFNPQSS